MASEPIKLLFDAERKLVARHRYIREAVRQSGKAIDQLLNDPFGGHAYLVLALLQPGAASNEVMNLERASDLIDAYYKNGGDVMKLTSALTQVVSAYLRIENTPIPEEGSDPNAQAPTSGAVA
jgi:hypothetical protein